MSKKIDQGSDINSQPVASAHQAPNLQTHSNRLGDPIVLTLTIGFVLAFLAASVIDLAGVSAIIGSAFAATALNLGSYFQWLLLATFAVAIVLAFTPAARARLGGLDQPEMSRFRWLSIILCTLLAGGGVFFAAAEPLYHFVVPPPGFDVEAGSRAAIAPALAQSFMHWGFLAWAVLGALTAIVLSHQHSRGLPLRPRTLLVPVFGARVMQGPFGSVVDAAAIIAVVAGTVGPIGFLATQVSFGLETLFGLASSFALQLAILAALAGLYVTSAVSGINRGIQRLSRFNVFLVIAIGSVLLVFGPTLFLLNAWFSGFGVYLDQFLPMATQTAEVAPAWWMQWWTVFFFAWFIGYGPLMAVFVARISRGRSIREMILAVAVIAPIATTVWFTLLGGSAIALELDGRIDMTSALSEFRFDVATISVAEQLPGGLWMAVAILILTTTFVATTGDSMSYAIAVTTTGENDPAPLLRAFWGLAMAVMAAVLLAMGAGQISALQQFIVVSAIPVSLILLPALWTAPRAAYAMAREQKLIAAPASCLNRSDEFNP